MEICEKKPTKNSWPFLLKDKLVERLDNENLAFEDDVYKAVLIERARRDVVFFVNQFCCTYDPRPEAKPHHFPFLTYPFQDDFFKELDQTYIETRDLLADKSRDMGVSWMVLTWTVHKWLFEPSFNSLVGSRKEDYVDNYQVDSLFGKLDYQINALPRWLLPKGYTAKNRTFSKISNPANGNAIQGESSNRDFSRAGRYSVIFLDEFAFWDYADSVWTATADSSPVRIPVSTPRGMGNKFADLRFCGDIKVESLHWSAHPEKDQEWYENEKSRRTPREVAQELDIDYEASGTERVFTIRTNKVLRDNMLTEPFTVPENWVLRGGLDYGTRNKSSFHVYAKDYDRGVFSIWEWRKNMDELRADGFTGSMVQAIARMLWLECPYYDRLDCIRSDPNLWVKNQNSEDEMKSIVNLLYDELRQLKEKKTDKPSREVKGFVEGAQSDIACIDVVKQLIADETNPQLKIFRNCGGLMQELAELEWEEWSEAQRTTRNKREKIRDRNNHSWDDLKYCLMSFHEPAPRPVTPGRWKTGGWFMELSKRAGEDLGELYED